MKRTEQNTPFIYTLKAIVYQYRWRWCWFASVFFFPIGVVFSALIARYEYKNRYEQSRSGIYTGIAAIFVASVEILILGIVLRTPRNVTTAILLLAAWAFCTLAWGIFAILFCQKINSRNACFDYFDNIIEVHHITSIAKIAKIIDKTPAETVRRLQDMIDRQRLEQAAVSRDRKEVVVYRKWYHQPFTCANCGADYTVNIGDDVVCPYCGHPVEENFLGDISDNVKAEKAPGLLVSLIRKNTAALFMFGLAALPVIVIASFPAIRAHSAILAGIVFLLYAAASLSLALSVIYGSEEKLESMYHAIARYFGLSKALFVMFMLFSVFSAFVGLTLFIIGVSTDPVSSLACNLILTLYGASELIVSVFLGTLTAQLY